jgi:hypothetical protein
VSNAVPVLDLTNGVLRLEAESDSEFTAQAHADGYFPESIADAGASGGRYLKLSHNWGNARFRLRTAWKPFLQAERAPRVTRRR